MDIKLEFERVLEEMDWGEVVSTLIDVIGDLLTPPQPPLPLPSLDPNQHRQLVYPVGGTGCSEEYMNVSYIAHPPVQEQFLNLVGYLNGEPVYELVPIMFGSAGPAPQSEVNYQSNSNLTADCNQCPYIKKPMNAFMIFRKELRFKVTVDLKITDSAAVNTVLGKMWRSLSQEEQAIYYDKAKEEKELHCQQYPGWSATFNYGRSKRMKRSGKCLPPSHCLVDLMKT